MAIEGLAVEGMSDTYKRIVQTRIQEHFRPAYNAPGVTCRIRFTIHRDGSIGQNYIIKESSGSPALDRYATRALDETDNLPPFYADVKKNYFEMIVTFSFDRNE